MRIRRGRTRSLFVGLTLMLITGVGLAMMRRFGGPVGGAFGPFIVIWTIIGLVGAAMAFYNALSKEGLPIYEVDVEENDAAQDAEDGGAYCPQCGGTVGERDLFCRHCGTSLSD